MPICTSCGATIIEGKKFCRHCGQRINNEAEAHQSTLSSAVDSGQNASQSPSPSSGEWRSRKAAIIFFSAIAVLVLIVLSTRPWKLTGSNPDNTAVDVETLSPLCLTNTVCGYIDAKGKIVIPLKYRSAAPFYEKRAKVESANGKYGFLDTKGKMVIPARFTDVANFHDGLARVTLNGRSGFIDRNGDWRIRPTITGGPMALPSGVGNFSDGLAFISELNGKQGWINKNGKLVISQPDGVLAASKTYADGDYWLSASEDFSDGLTDFVRNPKQGSAPNSYGYINQNGKVVIPAKFVYVEPFQEGLAAVAIDRQNWKWGFINAAGKAVVGFKFTSVGQFSDGDAWVVPSGSKKCGYINKRGTMIIEPQYDSCGDFSEGLALITKGRTRGFIDKRGNLKFSLRPQIRTAFGFRAGLAVVKLHSGYGYINKSGKVVARSKVAIPPF